MRVVHSFPGVTVLAGGALLLLLSSVATTDAATRYVSPAGNDGNPGTVELPWASPGHASRQLSPGDTLIVQKGRYVISRFDEDIIVPPSGNAGGWITIRGEDGARPVIAGRDNLFSAVILDGVSYVRIENLEITHDDQVAGDARHFRTGISMSGAPCSHVVIQDLFIHHIDEGALDARDVDDLQVLGCRFEYCGFGGIGGPEGASGGLRNVVVRGCTLSYSGHYYQGGDGSDRPYDRPDGFGIEPSAGPILIEDTVAEHNYGDGLDSKSANTTIRRCVVANNTCDGVKLWAGPSRVENTLIYGLGDGVAASYPWGAIVISSEIPGDAFELVNVTVDDLLGNPGYVQLDSDVNINLTMRNCIVRSSGQSALTITDRVNLIADHNLFFFPNREDFLNLWNASYSAANIASLGPGNAHGDPMFVLPAWGESGDYHLQAGSPAIDTGSSDGAPAADLEGTVRDSHPDMGAYEHQPPLPTPSRRLRRRLNASHP